MTITAWYMDNDEVTDQRLPHRREGENTDVSLDILAKLGVLHWSGIEGPEDPKLMLIRQERGYSYTDIVNVCPEKLPDYENNFFSARWSHGSPSSGSSAGGEWSDPFFLVA
jgi:1,2-dihydroxy-3-keto-5-methylthiopentene dioxygenase